ncbi:MAG TPA: PEP-CTERM sorting domain-containing protein [Bryobacteraceae bacterium]|jgi:hypothetical protein
MIIHTYSATDQNCPKRRKAYTAPAVFGTRCPSSKSILFAFLLAATVLRSDLANASVVNSTTCRVSDAEPSYEAASSGLYSCSLTSPADGRAYANVGPTTEILSSTSFVASEEVSATAINSVVFDQYFHTGESLSTANTDLFLVLDTVGDNRQGFLKVNGNISGDKGYSGNAGGTLQVGTSFEIVKTPANSGFCCSILFPFELGQPFLFDLSVFEYQESVGLDDGLTGGNSIANVTIQFLESDQITPVQIFETNVPEPASIALIGVGAALLLRFGRRKR